MAKGETKDVTPSREDITKKIYPGLTFEDEDLPVMDVDERKRRLSRFARETQYTPIGSPNRVSAIQSIQELNKMDKVYSDFPMGLQDNRTYNIIITGGEEAKARLERLLSGASARRAIPQDIEEVK